MKKIISIALVFSLFFTMANAQENSETIPVKRQDIPENPVDVDYSASFGVMIGTDIGGAVPFPFSNVPSPFNAYPQIKPNIGAKISFTLIKNWGLGAEFSYKSVGMKADARVSNQKFNLSGGDAYFTGSAKMSMEFNMLEVPLYATYNFGRYGKVLAGGYFSHILSGNFDVSPKKGYMGYQPDRNEIPMEDVGNMSFSDYLDSWDAGALIGYERKVYNRLFLGLRASMGFKDIFKSSNKYFDYNMLHMRGTVTISYALFATKPLFKQK